MKNLDLNLAVSRQCLESLIPTDMPLFQNRGVFFALKNKRVLLAFDTGLGKTFTYAFILRALLNKDPTKKHLFIVLKDQIEQAPEDLRSLVQVPVAVHYAAAESINRIMQTWDKASVILLTYECFRNPDFVFFLYRHLPEVQSISIDEAHRASNWDDSDTAFMIRSFADKVEYCIGLTATPVTSENQQFYRLMNTIDRGNSYLRDETFLGHYTSTYMFVNRTDYGVKGLYETKVAWVTPTLDQITPTRGIVFRKTKWRGAEPQIKKLLDLLKDRNGKKIIIYTQYHEARLWIEEHLTSQNMAFRSIHGRITKRDERQKILDDFRNNVVDILITSITESLNIEADCVIFYEFTTKVKQVIGRAHRGLSGKYLEIIFILTRDTAEVDFFLKYIYRRSMAIQTLLHKDYSELIRLGEEVEASIEAEL